MQFQIARRVIVAVTVLLAVVACAEDVDMKALALRIQKLEERNAELQKQTQEKAEANATSAAATQAIANADATQANVVTGGTAIKLGGYIDTSFEYNFNQPSNNNNNMRGFDVDANGFNLHLAELTFDALPKKQGEVGFRLDVAYGTDLRWFKSSDKFTLNDIVRTNDMVEGDFKQAYIEYIIPVGCPGDKKGITVDMGKFVTWAGEEWIEAADNINSSRSLLFTYAIPFTHTGVRATYDVFDNECHGKWTVGAAIYNGWDNVQDQNKSKTLAIYSDWKPANWFEWNFVAMVGSEKVQDTRDTFINAVLVGGSSPTDPTTPGYGDVNTGNTFLGVLDGGRTLRLFDPQRGAPRSLFDTILTFKPHCGKDDLIVALNADYGHESGGTWAGAAAYVKWKFAQKWYLGVRGEYFLDENGVRTGIAQTLYEGTVTLDYALTEALHSRIEYRHDQSTKGVFSDRDPGTLYLNQPFHKQSQNTLMYSWLYKF